MNAIQSVSLMPLPRLWYFPRVARSVLVMTGDQNGTNLTPDDRVSVMQDEIDAVPDAIALLPLQPHPTLGL